MASLRAKGPLRSDHPLFLVNKLISLSAFALLLCAGWIAMCYLKAELAGRHGASPSNVGAPALSSAPASRAAVNDSPQVKQLTTPIRLVYSCAGDREYYHSSTHLPPRCERTALGEEAALQRGLRPCRVCLSE